MLEIRTYILKKEKIRTVSKDDFFLCTDRECLQYITDNQYISGMIEIKYYGEKILGENEWDLVDQLWLYFIDAFIRLKKQKYAEFYFPDQPLKVRMIDKNEDYLLLEIGNKKIYIPQKTFIREMTEEAKHFFSILNWQYGLEKINALLKK